MDCAYAHCGGTLSVGGFTGYCSTCRRPVRKCDACHAWNRSQAAFCRTCCKPLTVAETPSEEAIESQQWLQTDPVRTQIDEVIRTVPQARAGFIWAMGEQGNLYRINPYERDGRLPEVCTRLWASPAAHAFVVRDLERSASSELTEACAIVSTAGRIAAWGLVSQSTRVFDALEPGEAILADARDKYQLIDAARASVYCLTRNQDSTSVLEVNPSSNQARRHSLGSGSLSDTFCGPAIVQGRVVAWSRRELLTLGETGVERHALPPGVELWTAPAEDSGLRLPLGRTPCIVVGSSIYLPCNHYGGPALLRAQAINSGWSTAAVPIPNGGGTLAQDSEGNPLLATAGRLFRCVGSSFRELAADDQMSARFAAFHAGELSIFFCEGEYGVRRHGWLQAHSSAGQQRVNWSLAAGHLLKECGGFWMVSGALVVQLLVEDRHTTTEFLTWHG